MSHACTKPWWPEVATVTFDPALPRQDALRAEYAAIEAEQPRYNVAGKLTAAPRRSLENWVKK